VTRRSATALLCAIVALLPAMASASTRYDPRLRFRTISTPRFDIHFHQGEETQARRLAVIAEEVAAKLDAQLGPASGRVQVILVNQTDLPNGWATPLPYNAIEITAAGPGGESIIGNTDDWLRLVFTHEYAHIVHLSRGRGWIGGLRRVFGRLPVLYPNLFQPLWQIEGLATYEESAMTGGGRLHAGDFRIITESVAGTPKFLPLDRASGGLIAWPSGHAQYAYGGLFHDYLAAKYGADSLARLTDRTAGRVPYFGAGAFRAVFNKSLGELWNEFEEESSRVSAPARASSIATRLTHHGFNVAGPRIAPDGRILYSAADPHGFPSLMALPAGGGTPHRVATKYLGSRVAIGADEIVFDQVELVQNVGLQSDLYAMSTRGGPVRRLTREARAADPDLSPDGRTIVFTIQRGDGRGLATMPMAAAGAQSAPTVLNADPLTDWSSPRWSRDGRWIAAERRVVGGPSEIVLVDPATRATRRLLATQQGRAITPAWNADGDRVIFAATTGGREGFQIYSVGVSSGSVRRLQDTGPSAHSPDVSPDGGTLVYVGYTADGHDLFSVPTPSASWSPASFDTVPPSSVPPEPPAAPSRSYSPLRTLAPRFWTPTFESDADELVVGAATGGYDALGRHAYAVDVGWSGSRARPDMLFAYAYDRWWPTLFADYSDDTDPWRDGEARSREANVGALFPFRRVRWTQSMFAGFHASNDRLVQPVETGTEELRFVRRSVRAGWSIDAARAYGYSISEEEGWSATVALEATREALGADGDGGAATFDARGYLRLGPRHAVLAARAAAARSWGDDAVRRVFSASGNGPQLRGFSFDSDAIGLIRGVESSDLAGERAFAVNIDYRLPLFRPERGIGTVPVFLRTVHAAVFADIGHAWDDEFRRGDISHSIGAELSLDAVLGFALPLTFTGGAAWRSLPDRSDAVIFGRVGRAF
jgi:hypothetical protein